MAQVKNNLRELSVSQKIAELRVIVTNLQAKPAYASYAALFTALLAMADALEVASNAVAMARHNSKAKTIIQSGAQTTLDNGISQLVSAVQTVTGGDATKIIETGFEVRQENTPVGQLPMPTDFSLTTGDHSGEIHGHFHSVKGARSYRARYHIGENPGDISQPGIGGDWLDGGVFIKSNFDIENLTSGQRVWVQVQAIGSDGQSAWSQPASIIVP